MAANNWRKRRVISAPESTQQATQPATPPVDPPASATRQHTPGGDAGFRPRPTSTATGASAEPNPPPATTAKPPPLDAAARPAAPPAPPEDSPGHSLRLFKLLERAMALIILALVAMVVADFPLWPAVLGASLAALAVLLWRIPLASVALIPALLPTLDLAPLSGRFYFDEFDLIMLVTLAMLLWHGTAGQPRIRLPATLTFVLLMVVGSWTIALGLGLFPLQPLDANAFRNYWSHYNAARVYKGMLGALIMLLLLNHALAADRTNLERYWLPGLWLGLIVVTFMGVREHWLFAGLFAFDVEYRITAGFSSMHTGGGHIEAYLVMAIPFLWLTPFRSRNRLWLLLAALIMLAAVYVTLATVSRGGIAALALGLVILALGSLRAWNGIGHSHSLQLAATLLAILVVSGATFGLFGGSYLSERMQQVTRDFNTRWNHWNNALAMRPTGLQGQLLGAGLGRFPDSYLRSDLTPTRPTLHRYEQQQGETYLRINAGETLYLAQRVDIKPASNYTLSFTARGFARGDNLVLPLCEKQLLDSHQCQWPSFNLAGQGEWQQFSQRINSGQIGAGPWWWQRPVELALLNPKHGTSIDVREVALRGQDGINLLQNGDFSAGGDYWFFKTHDHLPWHTKNLLVELLFEQGWFGVAAFAALLLVVLIPLLRRWWRGEMLAAVLLASIAGFLVVGVVGSLFDAPRLTVLFFSLLWLAVLTDPARHLSPDNSQRVWRID